MDFLLIWLFGLLSIFSSFGVSDYEDEALPPEATVSAEPTVAPSPVVDPIEEQFNQRPSLPQCGQWTVEHGYYEESAQPGWECLKEREDTTGAEAVFLTDAPGQASTFTVVRVADGLMEIYVNDSLDQLEPWTYESCPTEVSSFRQGCP